MRGDEKLLTYETSKTNITLDQLKYNIDYEVKIKTLSDGNSGNWSEIKKFKLTEPQNPFRVMRRNKNFGNLFG